MRGSVYRRCALQQGRRRGDECQGARAAAAGRGLQQQRGGCSSEAQHTCAKRPISCVTGRCLFRYPCMDVAPLCAACSCKRAACSSNSSSRRAAESATQPTSRLHASCAVLLCCAVRGPRAPPPAAPGWRARAPQRAPAAPPPRPCSRRRPSCRSHSWQSRSRAWRCWSAWRRRRLLLLAPGGWRHSARAVCCCRASGRRARLRVRRAA